MGISLSIFLIAVGAILAWAVNAEVSGIDVQVAGVILVVVGVIGLVARSSSGRAGRFRQPRRRGVGWPEHDHRRARPVVQPEWASSAGSFSDFSPGWSRRRPCPARSGMGIVLTTLLGIAGALLGGFLATAFGFGDPIDELFDLSTWVAAIVGALIILFLWNTVRGRRLA